jgi:16S rRNA (guanine966-N2)-methyltransferase
MRIHAGQFKGRSLLGPPDSANTRPMTGRVKKSLVSMLGDWMVDTIVVDLFSGTGTMGLETISVGAAHCYFAERDRTVLQRLRRNIDTLDVADRCTVWSGDILRDLPRRLAKLDGKVDLAFVDPPYADVARWEWDRQVETLFTPLGEHLADDGLIVLRTPRGVECPETLGPVALKRTRDYGDMTVFILGLP